MRRERDDHTLQPTALVNEVYLRLLNQRKITWNDRAHFFTFAARMMRNILKDHARGHLAERRGGPLAIKLPLSEELAWLDNDSASSPEQILDLSRALDKLEAFDARKAQLVELRFFLALTMEEAADVLKISLATAERDPEVQPFVAAQGAPPPGRRRDVAWLPQPSVVSPGIFDCFRCCFLRTSRRITIDSWLLPLRSSSNRTSSNRPCRVA